jgi:hypothetical protein
MSTSVEKINTPKNVQYTNILSHSVKVPGLIFLSGSTPVGQDGKLVEGGIKVIISAPYPVPRIVLNCVLTVNQGAYCNILGLCQARVTDIVLLGPMYFELRQCPGSCWFFVATSSQS